MSFFPYTTDTSISNLSNASSITNTPSTFNASNTSIHNISSNSDKDRKDADRMRSGGSVNGQGDEPAQLQQKSGDPTLRHSYSRQQHQQYQPPYQYQYQTPFHEQDYYQPQQPGQNQGQLPNIHRYNMNQLDMNNTADTLNTGYPAANTIPTSTANSQRSTPESQDNFHNPNTGTVNASYFLSNKIQTPMPATNIQSPIPNSQPYRQFVTTLLDSSTNKLVHVVSQPPPDYVAIKKRRNRKSISCMSCKRRKVKCDRVRPTCGSCAKHGYSVCVYSIDENEEPSKTKYQKRNTDSEKLINCSSDIPATVFDRNTSMKKEDAFADGYLTDIEVEVDADVNATKGKPAENIDLSATEGKQKISTKQARDEQQHDNHAEIEENNDNTNCYKSSNDDFPDTRDFEKKNGNEEDHDQEDANTNYNKYLGGCSEGNYCYNMGINTASDKYLDVDVRSQLPSSEFTNLLEALDRLKLTHVQNDEIDQLKIKVESLRFYLDDKSILTSNILKDLHLIKSLKLDTVLEADPTIPLDSFNFQFGASSITSYQHIDHFMGTLFKKCLPKIAMDIDKWKSYFSVEIYREALEKLIISENFQLNENLNLDDVKRSKFRFICKLLENYFVDFKTFNEYMDKSLNTMLISLPVVPKQLALKLINEHFTKSSDSNGVKIVKIESDDDFSEILLILAILRFGLPKSEDVMLIPKEINFRTLLKEENINSDNKTDLLNTFIKIILKETDLSHKYNIPMLGTLVVLFMISYTHRYNYKSNEAENGLQYGIIAIYMAISQGIYSKNLPENKKLSNDYLKYFSKDDYHNTWNLIMFIDTFSSFNSGIPQLISTSMDNIFITDFLDLNCAKICHFYRKAFKLANKNNMTDGGVSIVQYERFVIEFESFILNKLSPASLCLKKNDLVGVASSIRAFNLLLFLYYNSYFSFIKTFETFNEERKKDENPAKRVLNEKMVEEFKELDNRLFQRCIKLSIVSLIALNNILVSLLPEGEECFYEKYSFDLIQIFTRIIFTLTSCMCKMISANKDKNNSVYKDEYSGDNQDYNFLLDISTKDSECLSKYFVATQCAVSIDETELKHKFGERITDMGKSIDSLSKNPKGMTKLLIGFFFNTSRSLISQNFIYYALYKYFVMAVKQYQETPGYLQDFDIDNFESHFSYVDCTWFVNK